MTALELRVAAEAYGERTEEQMEMLAWQTAHLLSPHLKRGKRLTGAELLGRKPAFSGADDFRATMNAAADAAAPESLRRDRVRHLGSDHG